MSPSQTQPELFRLLPSVNELMRTGPMQAVVAREGNAATVEAVRGYLDQLRDAIGAGSLDKAQVLAAVDGAAGGIERRLRESMAY